MLVPEVGQVDIRLSFFGNANPGIADLDLPFFASSTDGQQNTATLGVAQSILCQIKYDLSQQVGVSARISGLLGQV
jgi:hypothetical protein